MSLLPHELHQRILSLLGVGPVVLANCALVDSRFHFIAQSLLWRTLRVAYGRTSIGHSRRKGNVDNVHNPTDLISFLRENASSRLLHLVLSAEIEVHLLGRYGVAEEFGQIFTQMANL
ncbi:hypothetical protein DL96DRAFT_728645 [Flagelloscypha sp. PMI_526]|nr:hypothetical protein DL96DRAFT_728645 [Flagelloscypha sp. PMI_526]